MPHTNSKHRIKKSHSNRSTKSRSTSELKSRLIRPKTVVFDENDRYNYLTGFSTRKKAAKLAAQERAIQRAKEEKRELRRQLKETRLSKIKETIEQQAEWYGVDAFSGLDDFEAENKKPRSKIEEFIEDSNDDRIDGQLKTTTTTVTIEPLEVDHTVLMNSTKPQSQSGQSLSHIRASSSSSSSSSKKTSTVKEFQDKKTKKKKKIPYESKATRTIEKAKKQAKRNSKSSKKNSSKKR